MIRQARLISAWGENVYVKIPVTNTKAESTASVISELTADGVKLNVTALMTLTQVKTVTAALRGTAGAIVSVFAGRVADTGRDPLPLMAAALEVTSARAERRTALGKPAGDPERPSGRRHRGRHHHCHLRRAGQARTVRQVAGRVLVGHREDVPRRRPSRGLPAVSASRGAGFAGSRSQRLGSPLGCLWRGRRGQSGQHLPASPVDEAAGPPGGRLDGPGHRQRAGRVRTAPATDVSRCGYLGGGIQCVRGVPAAELLAAARNLPTRFRQVDLLAPTALVDGQKLATSAVCSEVLEHVEDPPRCCRQFTVVAGAGLPADHYGAGRPEIGLRQAHRPFPAFHRRLATEGCAGRRLFRSTGFYGPVFRFSTSTRWPSSRAANG